jgi:A/G-specific adenine glycosylase
MWHHRRMATTDRRPSPTHIKNVQRAVLGNYRRNKRDLPWRRTRDPYRILVSEVMLQQTQVDRVIPKYRRFLTRFPTLRALAAARFADVLRVWVGLGYNARALRLWQCARDVVATRGGALPDQVSELQRLPGIGAYTAAAVAAIAFGARTPVIDVNVRRVLIRTLLGRDHASAPRVSMLALEALPGSPASQWAQALMDVGAMYCRAKPRCAACPVRSACAYVKRAGRTQTSSRPVRAVKARPRQPFAGSTRFYRGRVMRALSTGRAIRIAVLGKQVKEGFGVSDARWFDDLLAGLARDGLIRVDRARKRISLP